MIAIAVAIVLVAGFFHAGWNALLKTQDDPLSMATLAAAASTVIWAPLVLLGWLLSGRPGVPPHGWLLACASAVVEVAYFILLSAAYRRGTLSAVYSLARGTAPLLALLLALVVLKERLSGVEAGGVAALIAGLWMVRRPERAGTATVPALLTGVAIATYSTIDSVGVHVTAPWLYGYLLWAMTALILVLISLVMKRRQTKAVQIPAVRVGIGRSSLIGMLMTTTFLLILIALRLAPLAIVSPLRESAIVLVAIWGVWKLKERTELRLRVGGAILVAAGAALIAIA